MVPALKPFVSGTVEIYTESEDVSYEWPLSFWELNELLSMRPSLDALSGDLVRFLDLTDLSWSSREITAVPQWAGVSFSARASVDIPMAKGMRRRKAQKKGKDSSADVIDSLPDSIATALEGQGEIFGLNHPGLDDVTPTVQAKWVGQKLRLTVEVPKTLRAWADPIPSLEEAFPDYCDFTEVPKKIRKLLGVVDGSAKWDDVDINDETDEEGPRYSSRAWVTLSLAGPLSENDVAKLEEGLRGPNFIILDLSPCEGSCDRGGDISIVVKQLFEGDVEWSYNDGEVEVYDPDEVPDDDE